MARVRTYLPYSYRQWRRCIPSSFALTLESARQSRLFARGNCGNGPTALEKPAAFPRAKCFWIKRFNRIDGARRQQYSVLPDLPANRWALSAHLCNQNRLTRAPCQRRASVEIYFLHASRVRRAYENIIKQTRRQPSRSGERIHMTLLFLRGRIPEDGRIDEVEFIYVSVNVARLFVRQKTNVSVKNIILSGFPFTVTTVHQFT